MNGTLKGTKKRDLKNEILRAKKTKCQPDLVQGIHDQGVLLELGCDLHLSVVVYIR